MNEMFLSMYILAVETGRLTIDFVPNMYREKVRELIGVEQ